MIIDVIKLFKITFFKILFFIYIYIYIYLYIYINNLIFLNRIKKIIIQ